MNDTWIQLMLYRPAQLSISSLTYTHTVPISKSTESHRTIRKMISKAEEGKSKKKIQQLGKETFCASCMLHE